ncbi:MAG: SdrD B-like domain-containing protein, partial [Thiolinea sp.]
TLMLIFIINLISMSGYAATKAGTKIINQAHATYFDTGSGQIFKILSNYATFVVAPILAVEQDRDQQIKAGSGQLVYFPHTIINTGNQPDTYELSAANDSGDNGDLLNLQIYLDENGDGLVNAGEQLLTSTDQLLPGEQVQVVVTGMVPNQSLEGDQFNITVATESTTDPNVKDLDKNTVTTSDDAIIRISRTTDTDCGIPLGIGDRSYHQVNFTNIGKQPPEARNVMVDGAPLSGVLIEESIPDHVNLLKVPAFFSQPADAVLLVGTPLGEWISYAQWNNSTVINKLAVLLPVDKLKPGQSGKFGYTYQVVSLPTKETRLEIQTVIDSNNNGSNDFQSNISCNTLKPDDAIIKERPDLVLNGTVFDSGNLTGLGGVTVALMSPDKDIPIATTVTDSNGHYEFSDIPLGDYYLLTTPPTGYETSIHPPEYFTTFTVSNPSYGADGYVEDGKEGDGKAGIIKLDPEAEVQVIDIPLDREGIRGQIAIDKTASTQTANLGEPVAYTVTIRNLTDQDLYSTYIEDLLPPGFKYLSDTAKIDGQHTNDPIISHNNSTGRTTLKFRIGDFLSGSKHELTYIAQVTALATNSDGINTAFAHGDTITDILVTSPTASAQVNVGLNGVLSDRAIIFGRIAVAKGCQVSTDQSLNDSGFPLAGVRLYMEDGTYVVTDPNGQYSLYGLQPGMHVLKVDNHTLPAGVQLTLTDNEQAGDPDSRFVDLTPGDFYRADFTAACPEARPQVVTRCIEQAPPRPVIKKLPPPPPRQVRQCVNKPVEKKVTTMVTRSVNNVIAPIHFASGKADIPPNYVAKLNQLIQMTRDKQNVRFKFVGHTDNQRLKPSTKRKFGTNQGLSEARAHEVAQYVL